MVPLAMTTTLAERLELLERRGVVTTRPEDRDECCGLPRDEDGFCTYREGHPVYVELAG